VSCRGDGVFLIHFDGRTMVATEDQIRKRAYEIYQARGGQGGSADKDWQQAAKELAAPTKSRKVKA
jgi:hypothetical protein